jgi:hypothetical protein
MEEWFKINPRDMVGDLAPAQNIAWFQSGRCIKPSAHPKALATLVGDAGGEKPETRVKIRRARVRLKLLVARASRGTPLCAFAIEAAFGDSLSEF